MSTITMSVDCGKDETKVSILGSDGRIVHDRFKTRMEKVTALNNNAVQQEGVNKVTFEGTTYLIGSESDEVSLSNSKEELIHKIVTMTAPFVLTLAVRIKRKWVDALVTALLGALWLAYFYAFIAGYAGGIG